MRQRGELSIPNIGQDIIGGVGEVVVENLDERLMREGEVLVTAPIEHDRPASVGITGERGGQRALPQPRFARDEHDSCGLPGGYGLHSLGEPLQLDPSSNQADPCGRRKARRQRYPPFVSFVCLSRLPNHLPGNDRVWESLQFQLSLCGKAVAGASGQPLHNMRGEDLASLGRRTQPCRLYNRLPEVIAIFYGYVSGRNTDAYGVSDRGRAVVALDPLLHSHGTREGWGRGVESHHQAVPRGLDLSSAVSRDGFPQDGEVSSADLVCGFGGERRGQCCGADQVSEQHGDVLRHSHEFPSTSGILGKRVSDAGQKDPWVPKARPWFPIRTSSP